MKIRLIGDVAVITEPCCDDTKRMADDRRGKLFYARIDVDGMLLGGLYRGEGEGTCEMLLRFCPSCGAAIEVASIDGIPLAEFPNRG